MKDERKPHLIADGLRNRRLELRLSVKEVAEYLEREGKPVSTKTIYGWENDYSQPSADVLMLLCRFYGITNILAAFGYDEIQPHEGGMTKTEKQLIREYRRHKKMQPAIHKLLEIEPED